METPTRRGLFAAIFLSPTERRIRAGWRILAQSFIMLMVTICVTIPVLFISQMLYGIDELIYLQVIGFFSITISIILARRFIDRRSFASLGVQVGRQSVIDLAAGLAIAFCMIGTLFLVMQAMGWVKFASFNWRNNPEAGNQFLLWLFIFILTGWNEELLSRGYHLQNLRDGLNLPWAVLLSSAVFGVEHIFNPNASWVAAANITLAGVFFAFAYWRTQSLWLPIGLHIGWNFMLGVVFGFPVSGIETFHLVNNQVTGPDFWTGGAFGPEAGLLLVPTLLIGTLIVYGYTHPDIYPQDR